jgi:hypothetical protein
VLPDEVLDVAVVDEEAFEAELLEEVFEPVVDWLDVVVVVLA